MTYLDGGGLSEMLIISTISVPNTNDVYYGDNHRNNAWSNNIEPDESDDEFVHPNEEPPLPTTEGTDEDRLVMNLGEALSPKSSDRISKFETIEDMAATTTAAIATEEEKAAEQQQSTTAVDTTEQTGIKAMLQNCQGGMKRPSHVQSRKNVEGNGVHG